MWKRAKHSSKQYKVRSRATSKGISKGIPQDARKRCRIQRRLLELRLRALTLGRRLRVLPNTKTRARAVLSSAKWLRGTPEQRVRAASGCDLCSTVLSPSLCFSLHIYISFFLCRSFWYVVYVNRFRRDLLVKLVLSTSVPHL